MTRNRQASIFLIALHLRNTVFPARDGLEKDPGRQPATSASHAFVRSSVGNVGGGQLWKEVPAFVGDSGLVPAKASMTISSKREANA